MEIISLNFYEAEYCIDNLLFHSTFFFFCHQVIIKDRSLEGNGEKGKQKILRTDLGKDIPHVVCFFLDGRWEDTIPLHSLGVS